MALLHYPVLNKSGGVIASAVTNLDLHDIARASRTFGVAIFYVVTPLLDQKALVKKIVSHWTVGPSAQLNPARKDALSTIRIVDSLEAVTADIKRRSGRQPKIVATSARRSLGAISFERLRQERRAEGDCLLLFGTAWGMADDLLDAADYTLAPISGGGSYNHLSVRSAVSIVLDRLAGDDR